MTLVFEVGIYTELEWNYKGSKMKLTRWNQIGGHIYYTNATVFIFMMTYFNYGTYIHGDPVPFAS